VDGRSVLSHRHRGSGLRPGGGDVPAPARDGGAHGGRGRGPSAPRQPAALAGLHRPGSPLPRALLGPAAREALGVGVSGTAGVLGRLLARPSRARPDPRPGTDRARAGGGGRPRAFCAPGLARRGDRRGDPDRAARLPAGGRGRERGPPCLAGALAAPPGEPGRPRVLLPPGRGLLRPLRGRPRGPALQSAPRGGPALRSGHRVVSRVPAESGPAGRPRAGRSADPPRGRPRGGGALGGPAPRGGRGRGARRRRPAARPPADRRGGHRSRARACRPARGGRRARGPHDRVGEP
jgi:hypothetical protein